MRSLRVNPERNKIKKMEMENAAEQICNHEDLLTEILLNLPMRDVLKCKLVSKQWMSIISSTRFCFSHTFSLRTKGSLKPSALFIDTHSRPPSKIMLLPLNPGGRIQLPLFDFLDFPDVEILESCIGLLLCVSRNYDPFHRTYFICNPTTRKFKILTFPPSLAEMYSTVSLAFDPLKSPHYKIIYVYVSRQDFVSSMLSMLRDGGDPKNSKAFIDIYSWETNTWRSSQIEFTMKTGIDLYQGVFFNGAIHWYGRLEESQYLDVEEECVKTMPMPKVNDVACRYFGESGGHLNLVYAHREAVLSFSIFEMQEDYSNWFLKYSLNLEPEMRNLWSPNVFEAHHYILICTIQSEEGDSIYAAFTKAEPFPMISRVVL